MLFERFNYFLPDQIYFLITCLAELKCECSYLGFVTLLWAPFKYSPFLGVHRRMAKQTEAFVFLDLYSFLSTAPPPVCMCTHTGSECVWRYLWSWEDQSSCCSSVVIHLDFIIGSLTWVGWLTQPQKPHLSPPPQLGTWITFCWCFSPWLLQNGLEIFMLSSHVLYWSVTPAL